MRLIDADRVRYELNILYCDSHGERRKGVDDAIEVLNMMPTIDAVEVVRCKDCKEGEPMLNGCVVCTRRAYKSRGLMFWGTQMLPDDYCSYGKRKVHDDGRT